MDSKIRKFPPDVSWRIFISAPYGERERLRVNAETLQTRGHIITSSWLWSTQEEGNITPAEKVNYARFDKAHIRASTLFILDTFVTSLKGGTCFEHGYATGIWESIKYDKRPGIVRIGPPQNIFQSCGPNYKDWEDFFARADV